MIPQQKLAFDAKRIFNNRTGLGNYGRLLIGAIHNIDALKLFLFTPQKSISISFNNAILVEPTTKTGKIFKGIWRMVAPAYYCKKNGIKLYHGLTNELPFFTRKNQIKTVVTIHDLIFLRYPKYYPFFDRQLYKFKSKYACKTANRIVAISEQTKRDIVEFYRIPESKISVIPLAVDATFAKHFKYDELKAVKAKYQIDKPYFITVGTVENRKNQLNIVKALQALNNREIELIIVGNAGSTYAKNVKQYAETNVIAARFLKVDSTHDLAALYKQSLALIYVSEFEGFGIPPIEAMAAQTPIIASNTSSLPEVCGNAAIYVNPHNVTEIKDAMKLIATNQAVANDLIQKGIKQIDRFNINTIASTYLQLYKQLES